MLTFQFFATTSLDCEYEDNKLIEAALGQLMAVVDSGCLVTIAFFSLDIKAR